MTNMQIGADLLSALMSRQQPALADMFAGADSDFGAALYRAGGQIIAQEQTADISMTATENSLHWDARFEETTVVAAYSSDLPVGMSPVWSLLADGAGNDNGGFYSFGGVECRHMTSAEMKQTIAGLIEQAYQELNGPEAQLEDFEDKILEFLLEYIDAVIAKKDGGESVSALSIIGSDEEEGKSVLDLILEAAELIAETETTETNGDDELVEKLREAGILPEEDETEEAPVKRFPEEAEQSGEAASDVFAAARVFAPASPSDGGKNWDDNDEAEVFPAYHEARVGERLVPKEKGLEAPDRAEARVEPKENAEERAAAYAEHSVPVFTAEIAEYPAEAAMTAETADVTEAVKITEAEGMTETVKMTEAEEMTEAKEMTEEVKITDAKEMTEAAKTTETEEMTKAAEVAPIAAAHAEQTRGAVQVSDRRTFEAPVKSENGGGLPVTVNEQWLESSQTSVHAITENYVGPASEARQEVGGKAIPTENLFAAPNAADEYAAPIEESEEIVSEIDKAAADTAAEILKTAVSARVSAPTEKAPEAVSQIVKPQRESDSAARVVNFRNAAHGEFEELSRLVTKPEGARTSENGSELLSESYGGTIFTPVKADLNSEDGDTDETLSGEVEVSAVSAAAEIPVESAAVSTASAVQPKLHSVEIGGSATRQIVSQIASELMGSIPEKGGETTFVMTLVPETLGKVTVKAVESAGKINITITAHSRETAEILASRMGDMQNAMKDSGTQLEKCQVVYEPEENGAAQQQSYEGSSRNPYVRHWQKREENSGEKFAEVLMQAV